MVILVFHLSTFSNISNYNNFINYLINCPKSVELFLGDVFKDISLYFRKLLVLTLYTLN